jgi:prephenate dehydrogenase
MASLPCITIVGTGLIGTSMGLALRQSREKEIEVIGHDKDRGQARLAQRMGAVSRVERNLIAACARADMIVLAIPASAIRETLALIARDLKQGCVVTDTASVKASVLKWADEYLPAGVHYVGGDPILVGDEAGIEGARDDLFKGALYAVTPSTRASSESLKLVTDLVGLLGAIPHFIDPYEHDGLIGGTEHIADVLAVVLLRTLSASGGWRDMRRLCGSTFDRVTCFSQADASEYSSRALLNQENLVRWIDAFSQELDLFRRLVQRGDATAIEGYYEAEMETRLQWLKDRATQNWGDLPERTDLPTSGEIMSQMFFGGLGRPRDRE